MKNDEELFIPKKRFIVLKILLVLLLLGALGYGGYYYYQNYYNNPNKVVHKLVEKTNEMLSKKEVIFDKTRINGLINVQLNLKNGNKQIVDIINNLTIQFDSQVALNENTSLTSINTKYKNDKLINIKVYENNKDFYIYLEDIFDKYIKIEESLNTPIEIPDGDYTEIMKEMSKSLEEVLDKYTFMRKSEILLINDKEYSVYNNYLSLKDNEITKIATLFIQTLSNNNAFIQSVKKVTDTDIKKDLEAITDFLQEENVKGTYTLSIYTTKDFKQRLIGIKNTLTIDNETISVGINIPDDNNFIINLESPYGNVVSKITKGDNAFNIDLNIEQDGNSFKLIGKFNYEKIDKIDEVNLENSIKIEDLTEEDGNIISQGFANNKAIEEIIKKISTISFQDGTI